MSEGFSGKLKFSVGYSLKDGILKWTEKKSVGNNIKPPTETSPLAAASTDNNYPYTTSYQK